MPLVVKNQAKVTTGETCIFKLWLGFFVAIKKQ